MADERQTPERLWKYRAWDERGHARNMIVHGEIFFAPREALNDPFEYRYHDKFPDDQSEFPALAKALLEGRFPHFTRKRRRAMAPVLVEEMKRYAANGESAPTTAEVDLGLFSASEVSENLLMWSHYADHHRGICIGLDPRRTGQKFLSVDYMDSVPVNNILEYVKPLNDRFMGLSKFKSTDWSHEKEWRTLASVGTRRCPSLVNRVIIGARADDRIRQEVISAVAEAGGEIAIFEARLSQQRDYKLEIVQVSGKPA